MKASRQLQRIALQVGRIAEEREVPDLLISLPVSGGTMHVNPDHVVWVEVRNTTTSRVSFVDGKRKTIRLPRDELIEVLNG